MIQNQLGHLLELNIIDLDRKILKDVQTLMEKRERRMWVVATLAVFFLLHIRELNVGRNIFWSRYKDLVCPPKVLRSDIILTTKARILDTSVEAKGPH